MREEFKTQQNEQNYQDVSHRFIMTDEKRILALENFLKEAFCIDGDCKYKQFDTLVSQKEGTSEKVMTFILDDTKRGKFKVCLSNGA